MWLLLLAILLHFHFFFDCSLFNLHARALRYVFVMRVYSLFKFMRNGQKSVYSAVMIWLCSWNILLSIHHFKSRSLFLVFFFHFNYRHSLSQFNQLNYISLWFNQKKQHKRTDMSFLRPTVCQSHSMWYSFYCCLSFGISICQNFGDYQKRYNGWMNETS